MKHTISILAFILCLVTSCSTETTTSTETATAEHALQDNSASDFEKYLNTLNQIPLPFSHNSFEPFEPLSKHYDKVAFERYKHQGANQPLGILFSDSNTVTLLDFSIEQLGIGPFLTTYDKQGNKIDSLVPYQQTSSVFGHNTVSVTRSYLTINKNHTILVVDSITSFSLLPRNSDFGDMRDKVTTSLTKYSIDSNGRISS